MLTEVDHVAIAVRDLDAAVAWYGEAFGATVTHREVVERDGVEEALLAVADSFVQLLTPIRDDSTVAKFLETKGEGIHHVGYRVADCSKALQAGGRVRRTSHRRRAEARVTRNDGGVPASENRLRDPHRAGAGVTVGS